ncbi:MAG TPA: diguanylate cyclase, partial [Leptolinea sp.]
IADYFCENDSIRLQAFADVAAAAISNANLYESLEKQAEESSSLFRASTALLNVGSDIITIANQITQTVHRDFSSAFVAIFLVDETSSKLVEISKEGFHSIKSYSLNLNEDIGLIISAVKQKKPVYIPDVSKDSRFFRCSPLTRSEFDIPLIIGNNVIGVMNLESPEIDGFDDRARRIITTYAERAAIALENARLIERLQKREFQITLINRITQISLRTSNLKEMLVNQANILFETIAPDGLVFCFSDPTLRKIMNGYAVGADKASNSILNDLVNNSDFSNKLANFSNTVITNDTAHESMENSIIHNPFKAFILHALDADDIHLGSAVLGYQSPRTFDTSEITFFEQIANQIALALAKNLSILNANERKKESENLREAAATLTSTLNLQEVMERILETAVEAIPSAQKGLLFLYDSQNHIFTLRAQFGFKDPNVFTIRLNSHEGMAGKVASEKRAHLFHNVVKNRIVNFSQQKQDITGQGSWIVAPLLQHGKIFGVIELGAVEADAFSANDLKVLVSFADTVTAAIQNAQLHTEIQQIAITDALTGLFNRRGFIELGQREIQRTLRTSAPLSIMLIDVDFLKKINDEFGHAMGDKVLQEVANCCRNTFRQIDLISRYGGDEFVILLPETPLVHSREAAERLRKLIGKQTITIQNSKIHLSISIGVAEFEKEVLTVTDFIELADKALYIAKRKGRNSITIWNEDTSTKKD